MLKIGACDFFVVMAFDILYIKTTGDGLFCIIVSKKQTMQYKIDIVRQGC